MLFELFHMIISASKTGQGEGTKCGYTSGLVYQVRSDKHKFSTKFIFVLLEGHVYITYTLCFSCDLEKSYWLETHLVREGDYENGWQR